MKLKYEKAVRIATDLLGYCRYKNAADFHVDISLPQGKAVVSVSAYIEGLTPLKLDTLNTQLRIPRQYEIEQNYWNISGDEDMEANLTMVGMMVDTSEVTYENNLLTITVERYDV